MKLLLVSNPAAGTGRARESAGRLEQALAADGHEAQVVDSRLQAGDGWLSAPLQGCDVLVVVGGDGAVRLCAPAAMRAGCALYQVPCGTENLFAREWAMMSGVEPLLQALRRGRTARIDIGQANGRPFVLMASIGLDAEVVHDLAAHRRGAISHGTYALPIVRQGLRWTPPRLDVEVDGRQVVAGGAGMLVIGNSRQYARRIDPALRADMTDGLADVVFLPARGRLDVARWLVRCARRSHVRHPALVYQRGRSVVATSPVPVLYQIDGDRPDDPRPVTRLHVEVLPAALRVLLP
jgi:diacylglycerol kinase family enzyme